ncbi:hypothetical protein HU230_0036775 [Bradyrhizobium quebecense]|uniref:Uncharacterized protein n=1 Tax=Bradyrhizobium quebecense TaxID=2748629 RepID=A0A973WTR9_9BRAD|nr:hypothetical protein [Bradyrhizobium quebecense]UGA43744.1 hypothetical protein HU230_0036775 [Bradyrhizobium quebecense]
MATKVVGSKFKPENSFGQNGYQGAFSTTPGKPEPQLMVRVIATSILRVSHWEIIGPFRRSLRAARTKADQFGAHLTRVRCVTVVRGVRTKAGPSSDCSSRTVRPFNPDWSLCSHTPISAALSPNARW